MKGWKSLSIYHVLKKRWNRKFSKQTIVDLLSFLSRDRDIDSSLKLVLDVLEDMGVYKNDKQIQAIHVYKEKGTPMLSVSIDELE